MGRKITMDLLREYHACAGGKEDFFAAFGDDVVMVATEEMAEKICHLDYEWAAGRLLSELGEDKFFTARHEFIQEVDAVCEPLQRIYCDKLDEWYLTPMSERGERPERPAKELDKAWTAYHRKMALKFLELYVEYGVGEEVPDPPPVGAAAFDQPESTIYPFDMHLPENEQRMVEDEQDGKYAG